MKAKRFVFAGNRFFVLEEMLAAGLDLVKVLVVEGSFLQRVLEQRGMEFVVIESKAHLVSELRSTEFDYFLANGCPHILPVTELAVDGKVLLNVHPAPLPDLRGADPVPGALLHRRASGASCHVMDDGIDTGAIVSRVTVPYTPDLDCGLLYQMSFLAEKEAFRLALERDFEPQIENLSADDDVYFTLKPEHREIDFGESTEQIVARVRALCTRSQGARFSVGDELFRVLDAEEVRNPYLLDLLDRYRDNEVVFVYESCLLLRHGDAFLKFKSVEGDLSRLAAGQVLGEDGGAE